MLSTMQDMPLLVSRILSYAETVHGETTVTTWTSEGPVEQSFSLIGARAAAFAHVLEHDLGITSDQRVGSLLNNRVEHLEVMFATMCKGAVFTPLNKQLMGDQIQHIINHSEMEVIVVEPRLVPILWPLLPHCPKVRAVVYTGLEPAPSEPLPEGIALFSLEALLDGKPTHYEWPDLEERTAAAICYSTGTTGAPKGVAYSHRSLYLQTMSLRTTDSMGISHGDPFLCCIPIYHVLSWGVPLAAFMSGTPLVFPGAETSPAGLAQIIAQTHPRVAHGVPTIWISLMVHYLSNPPERMSLQEIFVGGSAVPPVLIKLWEERYGVDIVHVWGMTETGTVATVARPPRGVSGTNRWEYRISQGRFPASVQYRVVNDGKVMASSDRNQGEIQVRGPWVTGSYFHSQAEDNGGPAAVFRNEAVEDAPQQFTSDGWLRTGDVGSVTADGFLTVEDRARDVIRSGGEWIYSVQLENLVMEHADVVECAVIGYPDDKWGERPLAVTVLHEGITAGKDTAERLRDSLREKLPRWMLPEYWAFVSSIDKTSVGKFDKKDLRQHLADGEYHVIKLLGPGESKSQS
ncbi:long-chain fatty-acid--CoA ligase [Corynebacterium hindlerae]|uniref:long-chain fatty-acid--CoA ligase n=1 Tax=Corynebacterium hindlerae TaxID=699041 RepID=UPI001AD70900|nr:long-chain fatty-acid--CoA ligase [Corynebacterium hindlerae]QTH59029.1 long-chain fatty-acid--CoA ligase [Corynebacterium hindlerae]